MVAAALFPHCVRWMVAVFLPSCNVGFGWRRIIVCAALWTKTTTTGWRVGRQVTLMWFSTTHRKTVSTVLSGVLTMLSQVRSVHMLLKARHCTLTEPSSLSLHQENEYCQNVSATLKCYRATIGFMSQKPHFHAMTNEPFMSSIPSWQEWILYLLCLKYRVKNLCWFNLT